MANLNGLNNANKRIYTLMLVPERSAAVRRFKISHARFLQVSVLAIMFLALISFMFVHYIFMYRQAGENGRLKEQNIALKARLRLVQEEIARIDVTLKRIDQFSLRLRSITQLNDPERNLAIGPLSDQVNTVNSLPVLYAKGERIDYEDESLDSNLAMRLIDSNLESKEMESLQVEKSVRDLHEFFADHESLLATTPSIRPVHSKLFSSPFGMRLNPYTNQQEVHKGLDIASEHGSDVFAPADGLVIFVGMRGHGYGKTIVLDHGYGIQTHYAHLSNFKVELGDKVKRGQVIGNVGNTGRSTGPHLHYEVRYNGMPQNPERFMLGM